MIDLKHLTPAIQKFIDDALPNDGGRHTLALGEMHTDTEHLDLLQHQLSTLHEKNNLQTLGLELPSFFNLFLWAYRDGHLTEMLDSKLAAKDYLRAIFVACTRSSRQENAAKQAELTIQALDAGMDVFTYDSRDTLPSLRAGVKLDIDVCNAMLAKMAEKKGISLDALKQIRRENTKDGQPPFLLQDEWLLEEAQMLRERYPEYDEKLTAIEKLVNVGHQKIAEGKLTSDALSAYLFNNLAGEGNRITLGGSGHLNGIGGWNNDEGRTSPYDKKDILGTFGLHLFSAGQPPQAQRPHTVTQAVIATVASLESEHNAESQKDYKNPNTRALKGYRIPVLNLDNGTVKGTLWHPEIDNIDPERIVPLEEKFPMPEGVTEEEKPEIIKRHMNPGLMPYLKDAADDMRAIMGVEVNTKAR